MIERAAEYSAFQCEHPGLVVDGVIFERHENVGGTFYWKAIQPVTHLFGSVVDAAPLEGIGKTQELALQRLEQARKELYESIWI